MPYTDEQINQVATILGGKPPKTVDATTIGNQTPIPLQPVPTITSNSVADANNFQLNPTPQGVEDIVNQGTQPGAATQGYQALIDRLKAGYSAITGRAGAQQQANEAAGVGALTTELSGLDSQIFSLVNKANQIDLQSANVPNILQERVAGRGVTTGGLAPLQAGELRKLAIQKGAIASDALTLQSAYYAKNNQLGLAKQKADEAVAAIYDPIQQQIDQQLKLLEVTKPFMEAEQKKQATIVQAQLAERQKNLEYAREDKQSVIALIGAAQANYGNDPRVQLAIQEANKIDLTQPGALLQATNILAPFQKDPQETALKAQQIASARAQELSAYSSIETDKVQRDRLRAEIEQTKKETEKLDNEIKSLTPEAKQAEKQAATSGLLNLTNSILNNPLRGQVFGLKNPLTYWTPGSNEQLVKSQVNQLIANLSLENRQKLKGSGAISDFEARTLEKAASSLNKSLSNADADKVLKEIRGVFQTSSGGSAQVKITDKQGNSQVVEATQAGITQAINDGLFVEYQ